MHNYPPALILLCDMMSRNRSFTLLLTVNSHRSSRYVAWALLVAGQNNGRSCVEFAWRLVCMTCMVCACAEAVNVYLQYKARQSQDIPYKRMSSAWNNKRNISVGHAQVCQVPVIARCSGVSALLLTFCAMADAWCHRRARLWIVCIVN